MNFDRNKPYNDLPLLPPENNIETINILKKCITASRRLAELKISGKLIPNQSVLINTIPIIEAQQSSEIENIVTTTDKLFCNASIENIEIDVATKETLRYRTALFEGYKAITEKPLCNNTAIDICRKLRGINIDIRQVPGTAIKNQNTNETIYTPPEGKHIIQEKLKNWEIFINEEINIDPLIRLAIMHYQFEAIHPFSDGNGRTGRIMNILFLVQEKLLDIPVLYLSRYIIENKTEYYKLMQNVTENNDWESWILFILDAIEQTSYWTIEKIKVIYNLLENTCEYVKNKLPKIYSRELIETIFIQSYCRISDIVNQNIAQRQTAAIYLNNLEEIGVLWKIKVGRENIYINYRMFNLLKEKSNDFEEYKW